MLIGTDAVKPVVPVYQLITCIHPSAFEIHVYKCLDQIFKGDYVILGATGDAGHIVQDLSQDPRLPLQHRGRIYCLQMGSAQTTSPLENYGNNVTSFALF